MSEPIKWQSGDEVIVPIGIPLKHWVAGGNGITVTYGATTTVNVGKIMFVGQDGFASVMCPGNPNGRYLAHKLIPLYDRPPVPASEVAGASDGRVDDGGTPWHNH